MRSENRDRRSHDDDLAFERGVNEQYLRFLTDLVARRPELKVAAARNNIWTGASPKATVPSRVIHPVYGRVALDHSDEDLGTSFYIGTWFDDSDGVVVLSWAAPKARLFFDGRRSADELAADVQARRSFVHRDTDIEDFVDDLEPGVDLSGVFAPASSEALVIPEAPRVARPRLASGSATSDPPVRPAPQPSAVAQPAAGATDGWAHEKPAEPPAEPQPTPSVPPPEGSLRAEAAVRLVIERPRTGHLVSVLSTLQPDQYRLVTWPDDELLVVQGQPGTGKTIIATHRAAFLTHPEREDGRPLQRVLVVGPTDQYRSHVSGVLDDLGAGGTLVHSIPSLMRTLAGITQKQEPEQDQRLDTVRVLGRLVDQAARRLTRERRLEGRADRDLQTLVNQLVTDTDTHREATAGSQMASELSDWLLSLKSFDNAGRHAHALPFLACAALATRRLNRADTFEHIVVDEAQDVRPLEWRILLGLLDAGASLSLFGDMNQRRSDWSISSWPDLVDELELASSAAEFAPEVLTTGYRSTRQILKFANQLLSAQDRIVHAIRDGVDPTVEKVRSADLLARTIQLADELAGKYAPGLVAVVSISPKEISDKLRALGWSRGTLQHAWTRDGRTIIPLHPVLARGLEFDGVVVVEPKQFPQNLGREGLLYTSLTRATKELAVVHAQGLPKGLRAPGR